MPSKTLSATPGMVFQLDLLKVQVVKAQHADPDAVGYRFSHVDYGDFASTSDTEYFEDMARIMQV